ncbi:MAG: 1-acyl-sn-glycerol-3-phosphate acyltransferase [Sphingomonadales bacterium]|nr:1-acyl-sn-glycerol-3-phosphate acyltransferase [Sphingomonadales bacterium]
MLAWLICCVPLHYLWRGLRLRDPWPRIFLAGIAWISGVDVVVAGNRVRRGAFLLANHISWLDIPGIAGACGSAFVAQDGLAANPALRWLCAMNDTVFIARHDRASVARQVEQVRAAIRDTGALTIFPESTTSDGSGVLPFKSSLLAALDPLPEGIVVQPVWLDYGAETAEIAWVGVEPGLDNFKRLAARTRPIRLTVHFLPPITGPALANRKTIAAAAMDAILSAMRDSPADLRGPVPTEKRESR